MKAASSGRRAFLKTTQWSAINTALAACTGVLTARALGPEMRGSLALILSLAGTCVLIGALGTNVSARVHLPKQNGIGAGALCALSAKLLVLTIGLLGVVLIVTARFVDEAFAAVSVGAGFLAYGMVFFVSNQALDLLNAQGRVSESTRLNCAGTALTGAAVAVVVMMGGGLVGVIAAYSAGVAGQAVGALLASRDLIQRDSSPHGQRVLLRDGLRLMGLNVGQVLTYTSDRIVLAVLASPAQLGLYAVAITPAALLRIPSSAFGQVAFHRVATGKVNFRRLASELIRLEALLVGMAIVGALAAEPAFRLVFGDEFDGSVQPFRVLLIAEVLVAPFMVAGKALAAISKTWAASFCGVSGFGVLMIACVVLIPSLGALGAAIASAIAYGVMSLLAWALLYRHRQELELGHLAGPDPA